MVPSESLNDIIEEPTSEWGDDFYNDDDDDYEEELDIRTNAGLSARNHSSRPATHKTTGSQTRTESKRLRLKQSRPVVFGFSAGTLKRDPAIELIIETRKSAIIDNPYTRLAQTTSQAVRPSNNVHINSLKARPSTRQTDKEIDSNDTKDQIKDSQNEKKIPLPPTLPFDNDTWDDVLTGDFDRESVASIDKPSLQVYEEKCKRLNICPCSMIIRSLYTTKINLQNYGLGPKGSAALAVALIRNTNVLSLNLSGNNIGNSGMSHIYQIFTENSYVEEYDLSYNNLSGKAMRKVAAAAGGCPQLKSLSIAGNDLTANDINLLISKIEDHQNLTDLNLSHNPLDEEGGIYIAKWLSDNNVLLNLDISWCSIRLLGARAIAKSIGDNNKLLSLDISNNSFTNDTVEFLTNSLTHNSILTNLNLSSNEIFCRYDTRIKDDPSILIIGKEAGIYKMITAAATNQALKIFRLGKNHLDTRCIMFMLEALSKLENISLEELDLTGLSFTPKQMSDFNKLFSNHPKFTCYVGPIRQTTEHFANNLLNLIHTYCKENQVNLKDFFGLFEEVEIWNSTITYNQFRDALKKAKIPYPVAQIDNIMKYLGQENDPGTISLSIFNIK